MNAPNLWSRWTKHKNFLLLFSKLRCRPFGFSPRKFRQLLANLIKLNKIDEVWNYVDSLFKWHFGFVVIQKCFYHSNVWWRFLSIIHFLMPILNFNVIIFIISELMHLIYLLQTTQSFPLRLTLNNSPVSCSLWQLNYRSEDAYYIHKFQREKDLFITLSIVYIQISNTYLSESLNILLYVKANPVWICQ